MYENPLKEKMRCGEPLSGCMIQGFFPAFVEIAGLAGFDFIFIDAEHGPLSPGQCEELVRAAEVRKTVPFIRVPNSQPDTILRFMDIGAMGIIFPGISTAEEAKAAVDAVKYYPQGSRGLNAVRAYEYGMKQPLAEYIVEANKETVVFAIIENTQAIENLSALLSVDGIDGAILGTSDLSQSLGVPGQGQHPKVREAYQKFLKDGLKTGKPVGIVVRAGETVQEYLKAGLSILITSAYSLFGSEAKRFTGQFK